MDFLCFLSNKSFQPLTQNAAQLYSRKQQEMSLRTDRTMKLVLFLDRLPAPMFFFFFFSFSLSHLTASSRGLFLFPLLWETLIERCAVLLVCYSCRLFLQDFFFCLFGWSADRLTLRDFLCRSRRLSFTHSIIFIIKESIKSITDITDSFNRFS